MDQELQKALASILNKSVGAIETGAHFLQAQLPDVIHQLLMWKATQSAILFFVWVTLASVLTVHTIKWVRDEECRDDWGPALGFPMTVASILWFFAAATMDWLMILVAPKIYLIEYAARLASK